MSATIGLCLSAVPAAAVQSAADIIEAEPAPAVQRAPEVIAEAQKGEILPPPMEQTVAPAPTTIAPREFADEFEAGDQPLVFQEEQDAEVVERLIDYLEEMTTLQADFTQIAPSGAISQGQLYLRRPGLLRFDYDPPTPLLIVANGGMVYVRDEALETTDSYPVGRTPLKFLLRKKVDLDDARAIAVDRGVDNLAVTFASTEEETEGELTIIVSAPEMKLERWIVRDVQRGITVVNLSNVEQGERLSNRLFETPDAGGAFLKN